MDHFKGKESSNEHFSGDMLDQNEILLECQLCLTNGLLGNLIFWTIATSYKLCSSSGSF